MILLAFLLLTLLLAVIGFCCGFTFTYLRWVTRPFGPRGHRVPRWLLLALFATLLSVLLHVRHL